MALIESGIYWGKFNGGESEPVGKADSVLKGPRRWHKSIRLQRLVASQSQSIAFARESIYQSLALHLTTCMGLFFVD